MLTLMLELYVLLCMYDWNEIGCMNLVKDENDFVLG